MASKVVDHGLWVMGGRASNTADAFEPIGAMVIDDKNEITGDSQTNLNSPTNMLAKAFDQTPTRNGHIVSHVMTVGANEFNGNTVRRVSLHNALFSSVTGVSNTLCSAVDELGIPKTIDLLLRFTYDLIYQRPAA